MHLKKSLLWITLLAASGITLSGCNNGTSSGNTNNNNQSAVASTTSQSTVSETADNFYISYYSPNDVQTQTNYQKSINSNNMIVWDMSGDVDPMSSNGSRSLIRAIKVANKDAYSVAYWADWNIYASSRALPYSAYYVPGAIASDGSTIKNSDFDNKAEYLDGINYAFLEISNTGLVYFSDPWSDLKSSDSFCENGKNEICAYAYTKQGKDYTAQYGNFEAFAAYSHNKSGTTIDRYISIGGYGHDDSFENILGDPVKTKKFVDSVKQVLDNYKLSGVDLDYENPDMTTTQSQQYYELIKTLSETLGSSYKITVAILSNPSYLKGENGKGFASSVLKNIASLSNVRSINLMTYDFFGAFNYQSDGNGRTGFLANTYMPNNAIAGSVNYSAQNALQSLLDDGVNSTKAGAGIPTYGRALQGINGGNGLSSDGKYSGLFATIPSTASIPRGNLDDKNCNQAISGGSCSGSFTYDYIINNFAESNGFTTTDWKNDSYGYYNATTAYSPSFSPVIPAASNYTLKIVNSSSSLGLQIKSISNGSVSVGPFDWLSQSKSQSYNNDSNVSIQNIQGATKLVTHWVTYDGGPSGDCPDFNFKDDATITIDPSKKTCTIKSKTKINVTSLLSGEFASGNAKAAISIVSLSTGKTVTATPDFYVAAGQTTTIDSIDLTNYWNNNYYISAHVGTPIGETTCQQILSNSYSNSPYGLKITLSNTDHSMECNISSN